MCLIGLKFLGFKKQLQYADTEFEIIFKNRWDESHEVAIENYSTLRTHRSIHKAQIVLKFDMGIGQVSNSRGTTYSIPNAIVQLSGAYNASNWSKKKTNSPL